MTDQTVARRYARALHEEAAREGRVAEVDADVDLIHDAFEQSRELVRVFESPILPRDKKVAVLEALFGERVQPVTRRFMRLLVDKQREALFPAVVTAYRRLRDAQQGVVEALARTAQPLSQAERQKLTAALEGVTGKRVRLRTAEDPALLGGVVVRVGDTVYDGSVRHQLAALREQLEHGSFRMN